MNVPNLSLEGKVAIVTGAKRGIGKVTALTFAEAGADVVICGRVLEDGMLEGAANEIRKLGRRSLAIQADVSRKSDVDNLVKQTLDEFGHIDVLVNNAQVTIFGTMLDLPEDAWDQTIDISLKGYFLCSQAVAKTMVEQKSGSIVNISSVRSEIVFPIGGTYSICKAAQIMLTKHFALNLAPYNVRVNAVAPGLVKTELTEHIWGDPVEAKQYVDEIAMGRFAEIGEIASTILFLASDASSYMTGSTLLVDGGWLAYTRV